MRLRLEASPGLGEARATCYTQPMGRRSGRRVWPLAMAFVAGCGAGPAVTPSPTVPSSVAPTAADVTAPPATLAPGPSPTVPPALVGTWDGVHTCQRIVDDLHAAGLDSQIIQNVVDAGVVSVAPADIDDLDRICTGAVEVAHAHFFKASGEFGSLEQAGKQVDDGQWAIVDATTLTIGGVPFHYAVAGDELRLEPIDVGDCPDPTEWCEEAWKVMVAMPGLVWTRRD